MSNKSMPMDLPIHGSAKHDHTVEIDFLSVPVGTVGFVFTSGSVATGPVINIGFNGFTGSITAATAWETQHTVQRDGYFKNLRVNLSANNAAGTGSIYLMTGSAYSPLAITFTGSSLSGSYADTTDVVYTPAGTLVNLQFSGSTAGTGTTTVSLLSCEFWT